MHGGPLAAQWRAPFGQQGTDGVWLHPPVPWWLLLHAFSPCSGQEKRRGPFSSPSPPGWHELRNPQIREALVRWEAGEGFPLVYYIFVGSSCPAPKSYAVMKDCLSLIRILDHSQKSSTTFRRRVIPSGDSQTRVRSSANPRAGEPGNDPEAHSTGLECLQKSVEE